MFNNLPPDNESRLKLETVIIARSAALRQPTGVKDVLNLDLLHTLLEAWYDLAEYYEEHEDYRLDIEVLRDHMECARALAFARKDTSITQDNRDEVDEARNELDAHLETIISTVTRRRYPDSW